jgi:hypothetical protein
LGGTGTAGAGRGGGGFEGIAAAGAGAGGTGGGAGAAAGGVGGGVGGIGGLAGGMGVVEALGAGTGGAATGTGAGAASTLRTVFAWQWGQATIIPKPSAGNSMCPLQCWQLAFKNFCSLMVSNAKPYKQPKVWEIETTATSLQHHCPVKSQTCGRWSGIVRGAAAEIGDDANGTPVRHKT